MLQGVVNKNDEPIVSISLDLKDSPSKYPAVVDTGFNGYLSVPQKLANECAEQSSLVLAGASPVWVKISHQPSTDPHSGKVSGKSMREGRQRAVAKAKVG